MWARWLLILIITVLAGVSLGIVWGESRWRARGDELRGRLAKPRSEVPARVDLEAELKDLPASVARYFHRVLRDGQPMISHARVTWRGEFNMGRPGKDNWRPFTATQDFGVPGGFTWDARISMLPGVPVLVRDAIVDGQASMRGAVYGLVPLVDAAGTPELVSAALQRYLGEAAWFPTALLPSQGVRWTPVDDSRARASLPAGATTVWLEFRFAAEGRNTSVFTPERFYDDGHHPAVPRPWGARDLRFMEHDGMTIPAEAIAEWYLPEGTFAYWRGTVATIEYDYR